MNLLKQLNDGVVALVFGTILLMFALYLLFQVDTSRNQLEYTGAFWILGGYGNFLLILGMILSSDDDSLRRQSKSIVVKISLSFVVAFGVLSIAVLTGIWVGILKMLGAAT